MLSLFLRKEALGNIAKSEMPTASTGGRSAQFSGGGGYTAVGKLKDTAMPLLEAVLK